MDRPNYSCVRMYACVCMGVARGGRKGGRFTSFPGGGAHARMKMQGRLRIRAREARFTHAKGFGSFSTLEGRELTALVVEIYRRDVSWRRYCLGVIIARFRSTLSTP
ncbi:hypothetical protein Trydic_g10312 [Trypoxylus dichotomus]